MYLSQSITEAKASFFKKFASKKISSTKIFPKKVIQLGLSAFAIALSTVALQASAACQYVISNQWNNGFTAAIRISNTSTSAISGWNVSWSYTGGDSITSSWNATLTGTNPYSATNLSWNGSIQPGQTVEFGVQGNKAGAEAEIPQVTGSVCEGTISSQSSSAVTSSSKSSAVISSSKSSATSVSSRSSVSSSSISSRASSSLQSSSSSTQCADVCNWYGTRYPLCVTTGSGWGYENGKSCITRSTCVTQPSPYGVEVCGVSSSSVSSAKSSMSSSVISSISSSKSSSSLVNSSSSSVRSSSSANSNSSSGSEFTGMSTHFDGLGVPYGGCGIPQDKLETQSFVALNVYNSPGIYTFWPRPITGGDLQYLGEFNNGKNCGRWVRVTIQEYCKGTNDGAQNQPFCRGGEGWIKDGLEGATQDMIVADSCGDDNAWCRDSRYHLDFSLSSMNKFLLDGAAVNLLPNNDNNRRISWHYIDAPNYTGDINIYFMSGAEIWWPAISINHLEKGIHGVEQLVNGSWIAVPMNKDMGQAYILQGGTTHFQIRVRDVNDELINGGRVYNVDLPESCNGKCSAPATQATYTIQ